MRFKKIAAAFTAAALAVSAMAVSVFAAESMTKEDVGAQVFLMGNGAWNWFGKEAENVDGILSLDVTAEELIAGSKKDNDTGIGQFGIQLTNPIGKAPAQYKDGEVEKTLADGDSYSVAYSLKQADGTVITEGTATDKDFEKNGVYGEAVNILILKDGADFSELEAFGAMKFEAAVTWEGGSAAPAEDKAEETTAETEAAAEETTAETEAAAEETTAETEAAAEETTAETEAANEAETPTAVDYSALEGEIISDTEATSSGAWGQAITLTTLKNENGVFDPAMLTPEKAVVVYYEADTAPEVVLQSWSGGEGWAKVPADETLSTDGVAVFTYDYMTAMYQNDNFVDTLDAFIVGDTGSALTVSKVILVDAASLSAGADGNGEILEAETPETEAIETEAPAETEASETEAPAADAATPVASTGNTAVTSIVAVMALAGAAALISKRK